MLGKVDGEARLRYSWSTPDYSNRYQLFKSLSVIQIAISRYQSTIQIAISLRYSWSTPDYSNRYQSTIQIAISRYQSTIQIAISYSNRYQSVDYSNRYQ